MNEIQNSFSDDPLNEDIYEEILNLRRLLTLVQRHVEEEKFDYALATLELAVDACGRLAGSDISMLIHAETHHCSQARPS